MEPRKLSLAEQAADAAILAEFLRTPYWEVFSRYVDDMLESKREMVLGATRETFEFWKGVYLGAKDVAELPAALIADVKQRQQHEQEAEHARNVRAAASFHGSRPGAGEGR